MASNTKTCQKQQAELMLVLRWSPDLRLCEDPAVGICDLNDE